MANVSPIMERGSGGGSGRGKGSVVSGAGEVEGTPRRLWPNLPSSWSDPPLPPLSLHRLP
jgi:hypothetical protein